MHHIRQMILILTWFDTDIRKAYYSNPLFSYINTNSFREKIICLREVLSKAPIDIYVLTKQKSMAVSLTISSKYQGIN